MTTTIVRVLAAAVLLVAVIAPAPGAEGAGPRKGPAAPLGSPVNTYLNINNISTVFWNNGYSDIDNQDNNSGFVFPKGSGKTAVFKSGFLWGGRVAGEVRVGGSAYRTGLQGGRILSPGVPEDPDLDKNRIYRVRPDFRTGDVSAEVRDEGVSSDEVRARYLQDWNEWPWRDGAPYQDVDTNGTYDPNVDIPGVPGSDQTIFFVANDLNSGLTTNLYGSNPMGLELQVTVWAYSQQGPLGNMLFRKYLLLNKGTNTIQDMYVTQWTDTDLGDSNDDFSGCDTTLSVFFTYNAFESDATYTPLPPPTVGFDFFQGPIVTAAGDSGIFLGKRVYGRRNLPLTAHYYFARGDANVTDPTQGSYEGTTQFYNFMRGLVGRTGAPFTDPGGRITTFALDGDPVTGTGWIDGEILPAGDRRNGGASGPFTMAPGDTQEVVVAEIAAGAIPGVNRLNSINLMKFYDNAAQLAYNNFFQVPAPPPPPQVTVSALDKEIIFTWGNNPDAVRATETSNNGGFAFEGYNIYQLPSASATLDQAQRIATYDLVNGVTVVQDLEFDATSGVLLRVPKQFGTDAGITRSIRISRDVLRGGTPLINGIRYYFAITAYSFNPDPNAVPNNLENPLQILTIVPQSPNPGVRYAGAPGDTIDVEHTTVGGAPLSDGSVTPLVVDPARVTGQTYEVTFAENSVSGAIEWKLRNLTTGQTLLENQTNQSGDADYLLTDGFQVVVQGPPNGMKDFEIPNGARRWTWAGADGFGLEGFNHAIGNAYEHWFSGSTVPPAALHHVLIKLAATDTDGNLVNPSDTTASLGYRYLRAATAPPARPEFAPFILNASAGYAFQELGRAGAPNIPFAAYDLDRGGQRMAIGHLENNQPGGTVNGMYWPPYSNSGVDNVAGSGPREWWFIYDKPYTTTPDPELAVDILNTTTPMMWMGTPNRRGDNIAFQAGDEFLILANKINSASDVFTFTAPAVIKDPALAKQDISQINVFPNPYYGVNSEEINKYQRFVTFNHLPDLATIRIFNLAGVLVRTIRHEPVGGAGTQFERWDLSNESGLPVGSGIYIAHIDMPALGATKILKIAVVHEQQVLDRF